ANDSELRVLVETVDGVPSAIVRFLSFAYTEDEFDEGDDTSEIDDYDDATIQELWDVDAEQGIDSEELLRDDAYKATLESLMNNGVSIPKSPSAMMNIRRCWSLRSPMVQSPSSKSQQRP